jgi:enoyl-CoA hydratase/carnithine racemase
MAETQFVRVHRRPPAAVVTLDRPDRRNALSLAVMRELIGVLDELATDRARVIVIDASGPAFSAGHDLAEMVDNHKADYYGELFSTCVALMQRLHALPQPVVAKVDGIATAAGCQLVAACDLAVVSETSRFATPGVNIGLFCSTPMVPLNRAIGRKRALEMLLTGDMIDAATALQWGLVNRVAPTERLDDEVDALVARIASASAPIVALGKHAFYAQEALDEAGAYALTCAVMVDNAQADDAQEGMRAFLEKRAPVWPSR